MHKSALRTIVIEQWERFKQKDRGIEREQLVKIDPLTKLPHAVVISGIRRVGKSTLLTQIAERFYSEEGFYFVNFEDERLLNFTKEDFNTLYEVWIEVFGGKKTIFVDEVQNVAQWEVFVRRFIEDGFKFYITGSNASLLSKELGTKLTGRYVPLELFPFSFSEFLRFRQNKIETTKNLTTKDKANLKRLFNNYLKVGGMPEFLKYEDAQLLKTLYEDVLYRDVAARHQVEVVGALRELAFYLLSNFTSLVSYNKFKQRLGLGSVNTVKNYIDYLQNSWLIFVVNVFDYSVKRQQIAPKKVYCIDNGIVESVSFQFSNNYGRYLENLVFLDLRKRFKDVYYYRTQAGDEIDFLYQDTEGQKRLVQVTQALTDRKTRQRELKSLTAALVELDLQEGLILTEDEEETLSQDNKTVHILPVYKWLTC